MGRKASEIKLNTLSKEKKEFGRFIKWCGGIKSTHKKLNTLGYHHLTTVEGLRRVLYIAKNVPGGLAYAAELLSKGKFKAYKMNPDECMPNVLKYDKSPKD